MYPALSKALEPDNDNALGGREVRGRRIAVALLLDYMAFQDGAYQLRLSEAFHAAAIELDVNLRILFGRGLDEPNAFSEAHNGIFDLIDPESTQGVVIASTVLAAHCSTARASGWAERFAPIPIVSVGLALPNVPSVVVDNQRASESLLEHLVGHHGRRRIAFVAGTRGHPESEARLAGYRDVLSRHGLAFDPALVAYGNFLDRAGRIATAEILDRAGPIDALVAANDSMALGALEVLRERKILVPRNVVVTGFDDLRLGRLGDVALTTASQPFETLARRALELVLKQLGGVPAEAVTEVRAELVIRRSCGCTPALELKLPGAGTRSHTETAIEHFREREGIIAALVRKELCGCRRGQLQMDRLLVAGLFAELEGRSGSFLAALEEVICESGGDAELLNALHNVIDVLREDFRLAPSAALDDVWYRALSRVTRSTMHATVEHRIQLNREYREFVATADRISVALDLTTLSDAMEASLKNLGIQTAFVSRFVEGDRTKLEPLVSLVDGKRVDAGDASGYPAVELVPSADHGTDLRRSFAVFPLVFETGWLGVAGFEYVPGIYGYQIIRDQLAAALGHVTLHQQVLSKTMLHERSVQEKLATARRLEALSVLAGGVAHDLNNTLGPLITLPDVIVQDLGRLDPGPGRAEVFDDLYADIRCIKSAGMRAAQTIADLLTLGRKGHARREAIDLNRTVDCGLGDPLRALAKEYPEVTVRLELHLEQLFIEASEAHLVRALTNLVRNAAEAIAGSGRIVIETDAVRLYEPWNGYELIPPGEYAVVRVSDSGNGIPKEELGRVFEPFFSSKRLGDKSGSGLGLAIVHGVAKEHDGYVDLESTAGHGTTFSLYFARTHQASRPKSVPAPFHRRAASILVVEDDPLQARTVRRVLSALGYDVQVLPSGARALEQLELARSSGQSRYDLLLLDVTLNEELDGMQLLRHVRRLFPEQRAIVATGQLRGDRELNEFTAGVKWVDKPYTTERLAKAVEEVLSPPELARVAL